MYRAIPLLVVFLFNASTAVSKNLVSTDQKQGCMMCHQGSITNDTPKASPITNIKKHVSFLADDRLQGRLTGSQGEYLAAEYVAKTLQELGFEGAGDQGSFFQTFHFIAPNDDKKKVAQLAMS